jgi:tetratricopeptide (TPR) repeat protein
MTQTQDADPSTATGTAPAPAPAEIRPELAHARAVHDAGQYPQAEALFRGMITANPQDWSAVVGLADVLTDWGRPDDGKALYQSVIDANADPMITADAWDGLAAIHQDRGSIDDAVIAGKNSARLRKDADEAYQLGYVLEKLGRSEDAIEVFGWAFEYRPTMAEAAAKIGTYHLARGNYEEAAVHYRKAAEANPDIAEIQCNLASILDHLEDRTAALKAARRAIELKPNLVEAQNVMGLIWKNRRRPADAVACFRKAISVKPDYADAHNNLASVLEQVGQIEAATVHYQQASSLNPANPTLHHNYAVNLLLRGNYRQGWVEMNWRRMDRTNPASRPFPKAIWDGVPLGGRTILLTAEQGMGDVIQFLRYAPIVAARNARVIVEVQAPLMETARRVAGVSGVVEQNTTASVQSLPPFDTHCPLMSLPMVLGTDTSSIPANIPYITAPPDRIPAWKERIAALPGKKVGLVWAGNPKYKKDKVRSIPTEKLAALASVPGVSWVSLQKQKPAEPPADLKLADFTADLHDFADTAALIEQLDLVVAVDTAVAHLAGAMGKTVWILLPSVPDWRWLLDREDSPWYPTAKLFRQKTPGDWSEVLTRVAAAI